VCRRVLGIRLTVGQVLRRGTNPTVGAFTLRVAVVMPIAGGVACSLQALVLPSCADTRRGCRRPSGRPKPRPRPQNSGLWLCNHGCSPLGELQSWLRERAADEMRAERALSTRPRNAYLPRRPNVVDRNRGHGNAHVRFGVGVKVRILSLHHGRQPIHRS
jgi:hypothetical protein